MTEHNPPIKKKKKTLTKRVVKGSLVAMGAGVLLTAGTVGFGWAWLQGDSGRDWLRDMIVSAASTETERLEIGRITDLSFSTLGVDHVAYYEKEDMLFAADAVSVGIDPMALLWRRIHLTDVSIPSVTFSRLPIATDDKPEIPTSPSKGKLPDIKIDKINIGLTLLEKGSFPAQSYTLTGTLNLIMAQWWNSYVQMDVSNGNKEKLIDLRYVRDQKKPIILAQINDPTGILLNRIAGMDEPAPVQATLQGVMKEGNVWNGDLHFHVGDMVSGDLDLKVKNLLEKPSMSFDGQIMPLVISEQAIDLEGTLSPQKLTLNAHAPEWVQDDMTVMNPHLTLEASRAVRFRIQQGYEWVLNAGMDGIQQKDESLSPYTDAIALDAKGRLGAVNLEIQSLKAGNTLWTADATGKFDTLRTRFGGQIKAELLDPQLAELLTTAPVVTSVVQWNPDEGLRLDEGILQLGPVQGQFTGSLDATWETLALRLNAAMEKFPPYADGKVDLDVTLDGDVADPRMAIRMTSPHLVVGGDTVLQDVEATLTGHAANPHVTARVTMDGDVYDAQTDVAIKDSIWRFEPLSLTMPLGKIEGSASLAMQDTMHLTTDIAGQVEGQSVRIASDTVIDTRNEMLSIVANALQVKWKSLQLALQKPVTVTQKGQGYTWNPAVFDLNGGQVTVNGSYDPEKMDVHVGVRRLALSMVGDLSGIPIAHGTVDGKASLTGTMKAPLADADIEIKGLVPDTALTKEHPVALGGTVKARYAEGDFGVTANLAGSRGMKALIDLHVPMTLIPFALNEDAVLRGSARGDLDLAALALLLALDGHDVRGAAKLNVTIGGTIANPDLAGNITITDAAYRNVIYGTYLRNLSALIDVSSQKIVLRRLSAQDKRNGQLTGSGHVSLKPSNNPFIDLAIDAKNMVLVDSASMVARATSQIFIKGPLDKLAISGKVHVHAAEIYTDDLVGSSNPYRDYVIIEKGGSIKRPVVVQKQERSNPIALDIEVEGRSGIFVRGPGLESEWATALNLRGTTDNLRLNGNLTVLRGTYQFVDLLVKLTPQSKVLFSGDPQDPELALSGTIPGKTLDAILNVTGKLSKPKVELTSNQGLPSDEILARVLFGRSAGSLTPMQAVQVARTLARLSGQGGSGFDPVGMMRKALNVDTLGVSMGDDSGAGPTLSAGKYVTDGVYVSVQQGTTPNSSSVKSEIELTPNIRLETEISNAGDSKAGVQWVWDY